MLIERLADSPNPQFSRPNWTDLNGAWRFRHDDDDRGRTERWFAAPEHLDRTITVPFPPESQLSGIAEPGFHPIVWYARQFRDTRQSPAERLLLHFGAVDFHAIVWVDGVQVGEHRGGHISFSFDVTDALHADAGKHWVVLRAKDDPHDLEQPRGKQDWHETPHGIFYQRTTGIWQPVWTEVTPPVRIGTIRWRFDRARWLVDYEIGLSARPDAGATLRIELELAGQRLVFTELSAASRIVCGQLHLGDGPQTRERADFLWSPERPNLIGAVVTLTVGDQHDVVESYLGLRTLELTDRAFRINGKAYFLRLALNQGYWPESHLAAPSPDALRREVELIQELGFNGARIHQKIEDPRFLYWADRQGLLLWGESANAFAFSERAIDRHAAEWTEAVLRDRNHPSIIAWVPFNESWGVGELGISLPQQEAVKAIYHRTHQLDGTRPVIGNDGWENVIGDLFTIHDYTWDADLLRKRYASRADLTNTIASFFPANRRLVSSDFDPAGKPVMVTEFGGVSFAPDASESWYGYGKVRTDEEFLETYRNLVHALSDSDLICGFCYTQLTDTLQETNGLLKADRTPKIDAVRIAAATRGEPAV